MRGCFGGVAVLLTVAALVPAPGCDANLGDGEGDHDAAAGSPDAAVIPDGPVAAADSAAPIADAAADPADAQPCVEGDDRIVGATTGNCYIYVAANTSWDDAETACVGLGGHLATSSSQGENDDFSPLAGLLDAWVGGTDDGAEGLWLWVTGEAMGYTNWRSGEPNNANGDENCMVIEGDNDGLWDDRTCTDLRGFICERG